MPDPQPSTFTTACTKCTELTRKARSKDKCTRGWCRTCRRGRDRNRVTWSKALDWIEIIHLNKKYVAGYSKRTPYKEGRWEYEEPEKRGVLLALHDFGLLSIVSHPEDRWEWAHGVPGMDNDWWSLKRRSFLEFLIPTVHPLVSKERVSAFVTAILAHPDLRAVVYSEFDVYPRFRGVLPDSFTKDPFNVPPMRSLDNPGEEGTLYWFRSSATAGYELASQGWTITTVHDVHSVDDLPRKKGTDGDFNREGYRKIPAIIAARPLNISVWTQEWPPLNPIKDLRILLGDLVVEAGLKPLFAQQDRELKRAWAEAFTDQPADEAFQGLP
ncbi:hypothetical protein K458DRAFT_381426 [Lentithecium fluviatile CBS 122367]|uniref:Uncharacterized protein n=1 Tax=Lentithecium fluviatile CBS 122367 TaxID=1168545 RepID=A0A6G1JN51_9PLEO|nr:hypothetical protein K458DRAFT_381426 [Lentithecium fluviatile CBS 122367]